MGRLTISSHSDLREHSFELELNSGETN